MPMKVTGHLQYHDYKQVYLSVQNAISCTSILYLETETVKVVI